MKHHHGVDVDASAAVDRDIAQYMQEDSMSRFDTIRGFVCEIQKRYPFAIEVEIDGMLTEEVSVAVQVEAMKVARQGRRMTTKLEDRVAHETGTIMLEWLAEGEQDKTPTLDGSMLDLAHAVATIRPARLWAIAIGRHATSVKKAIRENSQEQKTQNNEE